MNEPSEGQSVRRCENRGPYQEIQHSPKVLCRLHNNRSRFEIRSKQRRHVGDTDHLAQGSIHAGRTI